MSQEEKRVVDFQEVREKKLEEKRRKTERIFFNNLINVYCVMNASKMVPVELVDVSVAGCAFQVPYVKDGIWPNDLDQSISLRMYFSQDTFLDIQVKIQNTRDCIDKNKRYIRYGCTIDQDLKSYSTYEAFVQFLKLYSIHAHKDTGPSSIFYL